MANVFLLMNNTSVAHILVRFTFTEIELPSCPFESDLQRSVNSFGPNGNAAIAITMHTMHEQVVDVFVDGVVGA